jgi:hypothetical protein
MKNRSFKIFAVAVLLVSVMSSCKKTVVDEQIYVDSYVHSIFDKNGVPVYNVIHSAYSFTKLASVSVTGGSGPITLPPNSNNDGYSFFTKIDSAVYKTTVPAATTYTYNGTYNNGNTITRVDATSGKSLEPAKQLNAVKTVTDIVLSWKPVANVEAYKIRIFSEDRTSNVTSLIYESNFLVPNDATTDLSVPFSLISFSQYLDSNISFEVSSFIFETNQDTFEAVSVTTFKKYFGI